MNERLRMNYLAGGDDYFGPDYGAAQVNTVARGGFSGECPNLARLFRNMTFTIAAENQLMSAVLEGNTNRRRVAKAWIEDNPQTIATWLEGVTHRSGTPITGSVVTAATIPGKCAAPPAPAMITFNPRSFAFWAYSIIL